MSKCADIQIGSFSGRKSFVFVAGILLSALVRCSVAYGADGLVEERVAMSNSITPLPEGVASRSVLTAADTAATMEFMLSLKMRNMNALQAQIAAGIVATPAEMVEKYYPTEAAYKLAVDWLTTQGFTITQRDPNRLGVFASGPISLVQQTLQMSFAQITVNEKMYMSAATAPSLPASVASAVLGINGLQPHLSKHVHSHIVKDQKKKLIGNSAPFYPREILKAYGGNNLSVTGAGQTIGIVIDTPPALADLAQFWTTTGVAQSLSNIAFVQVVVGKNPAPSGEESLDVEWASGIAPNAKVRVYVTTDLSDLNIDKAYQQIISELPGNAGLKQVSLSFGSNETETAPSQMTTDAQYFASMAGSGVSVFASSGDNGSTPNKVTQISSPSNDPSVTSVGGTSLFLDASGNVVNETVWKGSGGGVSTFFSRPTWQAGSGVPAGTFRLNPDVSAPGDPNTGSLVIVGGAQQQIGGTSWSSPTWAGFCALINEARSKASLPATGLLGPKLYPLIGTSSFRDITSGSNGLYSATSGFDLCTGIGVPNLASLIGALSNGGGTPPPPLPTITSFSPSSGPVGTTVTVTGTNFTTPLTLSFNGMPAQGIFTATQAVYQVPAGTATGLISIVTSTGTVSSTSSFTVTAGDNTNKANLVPYQATGWSDYIVVSNTSGLTIDSPRLASADTLYVSFSFANIGTVTLNTAFTIELSVDGVFNRNVNATLPIGGNTLQSVASLNFGSLSVGTHTLSMKLNAGNTVSESLTADNTYTRNVIISPPLPNTTIVTTTNTADANTKTTGLFTVSLSAAQSTDTVVKFKLGGTAVSGTDFTSIGTSVMVPVGKTSVALTVTPLFNTVATASSNLIVTLDAGTDYIVGTPSNATVTVNNVPPPLSFISLPTATPSTAQVGQAIDFNALVSTATGNTLVYNWDFFDGSTLQGASVSKTYSVPGTYSVLLTVTDQSLTASQSVSVTVTALPLKISSVMLKFNFNPRTPRRDSLTVMGTLPMRTGYMPDGDTASVSIGSLQADFPLNSRGTSTGLGLSFSLAGRMKAKAFTDSVLKFTLKISNQDLFSTLNPAPGFLATGKQSVNFPILITLGSSAFYDTRILSYSANGKTGTGK